MVNVPGYVRSSKGTKTYKIGGNTLKVEEEINPITLRTLFEMIEKDPDLPEKCALSKNAVGPINGQYFHFPSKGGFLTGGKSRLVKRTK